MKLISQRTKEAILDAVSIDTYAQITGERPKRSGANYFIKSPFSDEKTGSFCIWNDMRYKCFSSGKSGDIISLVMETQAQEYPDAVRQLADMLGVIVEYEGTDTTPEERDKRDELQRCLEGAMHLYLKKREALADDHHCMQHLLETRQLDRASIDSFELGYAPADGAWLAGKLLEQGLIMAALELGLVKTTDDSQRRYDAMRDAIVYPIRNKAGRMCGFACRPFSGKPAKYLNAPASDLYDKSRLLYGMNLAKRAIRKLGFAYVTEGYFDVMSLHRAGAENSVATCGTALTEAHCDLLKRHCKRVVILRDGDKAGKKAAKRDFELLLKAGLVVEVCHLPHGQDPDDYVRQHMPPQKSYRELDTEKVTA
jgi:DNA primase catalytic core